MFKHISYVIITASDMSRSVGFYCDKLGVPLNFQTEQWTEFQTGQTILALHGGGIPAERKPAAGRPEPQAGNCTIGFQVENLERTFEELKSKGVTPVMPPVVREREGIKLAVIADPDGFKITLSQPLQHK